MGIGPNNDSSTVTETGAGGIFNHIFFTLSAALSVVIGGGRAQAVSMFQSLQRFALREHPNSVLPPEIVATAVVKGVVEPGVGADEARSSGVSPERFGVLVDTTGNAPGWTDLLDQWRRGLIDEGRLEHGIRTGLLRNEWVPFVKALRFVPLTAAQYLMASVRGHLGHDEAIAKAGTLGYNPSDAELLFQSLGSPPGVQQTLELWNRGYIDEGEVDQIILESDYKPKYLDTIKKLAVYLPPPRTTTALLRNGSIDEGTAQRLFEQYGLAPDLAAAYVRDAAHGKVTSHKQVSVTTIKSLFVDHLITRDQALVWLEKIGYTPEDSDTLLTLASFEAQQKLHSQTITKIRQLFVGKHITEEVARADLAHLNVDMTQTADLIDLWKLEQQVPSKELTLTQLTKAAEANVIDVATWEARVRALGYSQVDTDILKALDFPPAGA